VRICRHAPHPGRRRKCGQPRKIYKLRVVRLSILGSAVAGVLALGSASASAASHASIAFVQSATGGTVQHGRLTLRGVGGDVAWFTNGRGNQSDETSFARLRRALFSPPEVLHDPPELDRLSAGHHFLLEVRHRCLESPVPTPSVTITPGMII
jgi:hypothetical protein